MQADAAAVSEKPFKDELQAENEALDVEQEVDEEEAYSDGDFEQVPEDDPSIVSEEDEARAWREEFRSLDQAGAYFFSLNRYVFAGIKL